MNATELLTIIKVEANRACSVAIIYAIIMELVGLNWQGIHAPVIKGFWGQTVLICHMVNHAVVTWSVLVKNVVFIVVFHRPHA